MLLGKAQTRIQEACSTGFILPRYVRPSFVRLLRTIPAEYVGGLHTVVLTDSQGLSRRRSGKVRARGRRTTVRDCWALYHAKTRDREAWIEVFVDNVVKQWGMGILRVPFWADLAFSEVLFHELGHHISEAVRPSGHGNPEGAAQRWQRKLTRSYFARQYWYLMPLLLLVWAIGRLVAVSRLRYG
jgi:hypothetical protein